MAKSIESHCTNHPGVMAVGHCKQCGKPFCSLCEVPGETGRFCSEACRDRHAKFTESVRQMEERAPKITYAHKAVRIAVQFVGRLLVVLIAIGFLGVAASLVHIPLLSDAVEWVRGWLDPWLSSLGVPVSVVPEG